MGIAIKAHNTKTPTTRPSPESPKHPFFIVYKIYKVNNVFNLNRKYTNILSNNCKTEDFFASGMIMG